MTGARARYDSIGVGYAGQRRPDPRIEAHINKALGEARTVLNVGAGPGNYEPRDRDVVAIDPSEVMIRQRPPGAAPVLLGVAEALPFADRAFDAGMAVLSTQHWSEPARGLHELARVAGRQVVFTWDARFYCERFWLLRDYLPEMAKWEGDLATCDTVAEVLGAERVEPVPVPHDCVDGFGAAYWRRPEAYLDPEVRASISGLALLEDGTAGRAMNRLRADLESGEWRARNAELLELDEFDVGYRLVIADQG
ncbi:MAG TPA: methyltransferase domain-containing protein [Acidimicrobiia bacterium]|nr:methyltransferase domain-containing protein [Acidimicrobiia bacterium]